MMPSDKTIVRFYCFAQHCTQAGMVVPTTKLDDYRAGEEDQSHDIFLAYEGTEEEVREQAAADITRKGWSFNHTVARNVLYYIGE